MTTHSITLGSLQAGLVTFAARITAFAKPQKAVERRIPEARIRLAQGERYAGIVLDDAGKPSHHLILLPGAREDLNHADALAWANAAGGDLPTSSEQSLLYANLKSAFEPAAYWSCEDHRNMSVYARYQIFRTGSQCVGDKDAQLRAVAIRRVAI